MSYPLFLKYNNYAVSIRSLSPYVMIGGTLTAKFSWGAEQ